MAGVIIHWMQKCRGGPIKSPGIVLSHGGRERRWGGGRFRVACMPRRKNTHGLACTDSPRVVNCPACQAAPGFPAEVGERVLREDLVPAAVEHELTGGGEQ